jgi:hypothetical protein
MNFLTGLDLRIRIRIRVCVLLMHKIFESGFGKQNPDPFALIFRSIRGSESRPDLELYAFRVFDEFFDGSGSGFAFYSSIRKSESGPIRIICSPICGSGSRLDSELYAFRVLMNFLTGPDPRIRIRVCVLGIKFLSPDSGNRIRTHSHYFFVNSWIRITSGSRIICISSFDEFFDGSRSGFAFHSSIKFLSPDSEIRIRTHSHYF